MALNLTLYRAVMTFTVDIHTWLMDTMHPKALCTVSVKGESIFALNNDLATSDITLTLDLKLFLMSLYALKQKALFGCSISQNMQTTYCFLNSCKLDSKFIAPCCYIWTYIL